MGYDMTVEIKKMNRLPPVFRNRIRIFLIGQIRIKKAFRCRIRIRNFFKRVHNIIRLGIQFIWINITL